MKSSERQERMTLLRRKAILVKKDVETHKTAELLAEYYEILNELERISRIEAGFQSIMTFAKTYFMDVDPPFDLLKSDTPSPPFHYELCQYLREMILTPAEVRTAIAAPRSHAKSVMITNIFTIWTITYVEDIDIRYMIILGDKQEGAKKFLEILKDNFEGNEKYINDFGKIKGDTWSALEIVTSTGVKVTAAGSGEALRGLRFGSYRPDLIILDDVESDESTETAARREKTLSWFRRTVGPLGSPGKSKIVIVGTVIHQDSLLAQMMRTGGWKKFRYEAIQEWPINMHLWQEYEKLYHSRDEGNSPEEATEIAYVKATRFYEEHKAEMDEGAKVLWPERMPLLKLMEKRTEDRLSFNSEYQSAPRDESTRMFARIAKYNPDLLDWENLDYYGALDPSMGESVRSDPSAIVTIGRHRKTGLLYVVDADARRRSPDDIIRDVFEKHKRYNYKAFSVESIAFQSFLKDEIIKRSASQGIYLPVKPFKSTTKKMIRISALEPLLSNGTLMVSPKQMDLIEQAEYYPRSSHDDLLDSCAQCVELIKSTAGARVIYGHI